ncbi:MAG TPA: SGNH/GDSL hydrolase family protein, partial [Acidimicrobiales bacterium]|nr:SGNH/GDSL hydrolase family protein [Acidimicrobiales bacterium]
FTATTRALLAAGAIAFLTVAIPAGQAAATGPVLKASPAKLLNPGDVVSLIGKNMVGDSGDFLAQCATTATTTADCDLSTESAITVDSKGHMLTPTTFTVAAPSNGMCGSAALHVPTLTCSIALVVGTTATPLAKITFPAYYLSLGDSYSVGYQPSPTSAATYGYTGYVAKKEKLTLENFGCGGATTASMTVFTGVCGVDGFGPPAAFNAAPIPSGDSQVTAADTFIAAHPDQIALMTLSISGNDITPCAGASPTNPVNGATDAVSCVTAGMASVNANLGGIVSNLSAAAPGVPLVGLTYPDVLLGLYVCTPNGDNTCSAGDHSNPLIGESTYVFQYDLNPALSGVYTSVPGGIFVDVTADTGAYGSMTQFKGSVFGKVPAPVASVCKLTWYCAEGNIHANTKGYQDIGKFITAALP